MKTRVSSIIMALILLLSVVVPSNNAYGLGINPSKNDIEFYDSNACVVSGTGTKTLVGNDNAEKIMRYLVGKELTIAQAAGIMGNIRKESNYQPNIEQGGAKVDDNYILKDGVGFGLVQWTSGGRQQGLVKYSESSSRSITDMSMQLDYIWQELSTGYKGALESLKKIDNPVEAAIDFEDKYEKSADSPEVVRNIRGGYAQEAYDSFKDIVPDVNNNEISGGISCTGDGEASMFIDGFAIYNQNDPQWNNKSYGTSTIGEAGCGPSAMAMIITSLTGKTVTPVDTADYAYESGMYVDGQGSSHGIASKLASHWGLSAKGIDGAGVSEVEKILRDGGLIIAVADGNAPYTNFGHFIVIRAVNENGKWLVGDSNGIGGGMANSQKEWDPMDILVSGVNMWAITK